jgi:hypothetical protein
VQTPEAEGGVGVLGSINQSKQAKTGDDPGGKCSGRLPYQQGKILLGKGLRSEYSGIGDKAEDSNGELLSRLLPEPLSSR